MDKPQSIWIQIRTFNGPMNLCITEFIEYFKSRSTLVYVAFLDASKAFDKISHWTLFKKLLIDMSSVFGCDFVLLVSTPKR